MQKSFSSTKEHVLRMLEEQRGQSISGAQLAAALSISRAAVWKTISELRQEGYEISAVTNKGYALAADSDVLSPQGIAAHLRHREYADLIHTYESVESTNLTIKQLSAADAPHGTLVTALTQTAGRGRLGRSFHSPSGCGVYLSILLRPHTSDENPPFNPVLITSAAAVAVARAILQVSGRDVQIKWVNDLYLDGKKICGILTEGITNFETGSIESIVIGIGVNCFSDNELPIELAGKAAALFDSSLGTPMGFSRNALIAAIHDCILDIIPELATRDFLEEYRRRCFILGTDIYFYPRGMNCDTAFPELPPEGGIRGYAAAIDDDGGLVVRLTDGTERILSTGEISIRPTEYDAFLRTNR